MPLSDSLTNIAVVCNPRAGVGKAVHLSDQIAHSLENRKINHQLFKGSWPEDWSGFSDVFLVGGDGTLNYFINRYPDLELPMVLFAGGTGNDFHWMLYGNTTIEQQLDRVLATAPRPIDAGRCNDRFFMNGLGIGFEGEVAAGLMGKKKRLGKKSFLLAVLKKILFYRSRRYRLRIGDEEMDDRFMMISIMNGKRAGGDFHISPESAPDDGLLNVVMVKPVPVWKRFFYLPMIERGKHLQLGIIRHCNTSNLTIECDEPIIAHLDGEYYTAKKMEVSILPEKFRFRY